jgi:hypothetical protein
MKLIKYYLCLLASILLLIVPQSSFADDQGEMVRCGCYCGAVILPPCDDAACRSACGGDEPVGPQQPTEHDDTSKLPPNVHKNDDGILTPDPGYEWLNLDDDNDFTVTLKEGLVLDDDGNIKLAPGYEWIDPDNNDNWDARLMLGLVLDDDGNIKLAPGYEWVDPDNDDNWDARLMQGLVLRNDGGIDPAPGYDWVDPGNKNNLDVKRKLRQELADMENIITWSGPWDKEKKDIVLTVFDGFNDTELRDWIADNVVNFNLLTDPGLQKQISPWMGGPNNTDLIFTTYFFDSETDITKTNLIAFESGKVFWQQMKDKPIDEAQTLERWFINDFLQKYPQVISSMKDAKYLDQNLFDIGYGVTDYSDYYSQFGLAFRAQALGLLLDTPEGLNAQQEFKEHINSLLQDN